MINYRNITTCNLTIILQLFSLISFQGKQLERVIWQIQGLPSLPPSTQASLGSLAQQQKLRTVAVDVGNVCNLNLGTCLTLFNIAMTYSVIMYQYSPLPK